MNRRPPSSSPRQPSPAPSASNTRLLAWQILRAWQPDGVFAEEMVDHTARRNSLSSPNRAFLKAMVFAALRNLTLLDAWIDELRDGGKLDHDTRGWLRLGLVQCLILGLPEHAAVHETVELSGRGRGLVNAVLRRALRERTELEKLRLHAPPDIRFSLPEFLTDRWTKHFHPLGMEKLGTWSNTPAPIIVRVNKLFTGAEAKLAAVPGLTPLEKHEGFFLCAELPLDALASGWCYAQDPSTAEAPILLAPTAGMTVLDACAAPGGKAALLAQMMENQGALVATDSALPRLERLRGNLQRLHVKNAEILAHDWETTPAPASWKVRFPDGFDRILVDVPCSNTGVIRRRVDVRWRLNPGSFTEMARRQITLLSNLLPLLRPGGRLVYSTCSIEPEENEHVVRAVIAKNPAYRQLQTRSLVPHLTETDGAWASLIERIP
ncbi:MAG: transcription antitermination factor NusB [Verrucomicrobiota bacterium]